MGGRLASVQTAVDYQLDAGLVAGFVLSVENVGAAAVNITPPAGLLFQAGVASVPLRPGHVLLATNVGGRLVFEHLGQNYDPVIVDDANTVAHVFFDGKGIRDLWPNAWALNGSVPQVPASYPLPPGAGPFSAANYYSLGSGSDVLDFAGDFSVALVYSWAPTTEGNLVDASDFNLAGWRVDLRGGGSQPAMIFYDGLGAHVVFMDPADLATTGTLCVWCGGRSGTNAVQKFNLNPIRTAATGSSAVAATAVAPRLGCALNGSAAYPGTAYEAWFSTTTPSDALFTTIAQRVKQRLQITAW